MQGRGTRGAAQRARHEAGAPPRRLGEAPSAQAHLLQRQLEVAPYQPAAHRQLVQLAGQRVELRGLLPGARLQPQQAGHRLLAGGAQRLSAPGSRFGAEEGRDPHAGPQSGGGGTSRAREGRTEEGDSKDCIPHA